jgi:hypothetical protein
MAKDVPPNVKATLSVVVHGTVKPPWRSHEHHQTNEWTEFIKYLAIRFCACDGLVNGGGILCGDNNKSCTGVLQGYGLTPNMAQGGDIDLPESQYGL